jgi:cytochrome c oxidase assembly factor CtaG
VRTGAAAAFALGAFFLAPAAAFAHTGPVPRSELAGAWQVDWPVALLVALAAVLFAQAFVRLRRRGRSDHAGGGRALLFAAGLAVALLALCSPLDPTGEQYLMSAHMLQHMLIGDAAPALLVAAVRGPLVLFLLPPLLLRPLAHAGRLRGTVSFLLRPGVSFGLWLVIFAIWHIPAAYDAVLGHPLLHDLEHASFVLAGVLVWAQMIDPARRHALSRYRRLAFAVALFAAGQVISDVLIFSFHPLYPAYERQPERLFGLSPVLDQQLAGVVMMVEQLVALGLFCAFLLLKPVGRRPRGRELAARAA